jgi:lipoyl-dependent peroxiredoxin
MAQPEPAKAPFHIEKVLYTARTHTTGGREGHSRTDDGRLDLKLSPPGKEGADAGTNPEQLFAVGWSGCYLSSMKIVADKKKIILPPGLAVDVEVDLGHTGVDYGIAGRLKVYLPGMDRQTAESLAEASHHVCAYSRATHGNIEVSTTVVV